MNVPHSPPPRYLVLGCHRWNREVFGDSIQKLPGTWLYLEGKQNLNIELVRNLHPKKIFFLHWSWKVPEEITSNYECIGFHMTDLPYGRGGSPLQNLIEQGHDSTMVTALRLEKEYDSGQIYLKRFLTLEGSAEEIYYRANYKMSEMIRDMVENEITPQSQAGKISYFTRRIPEQSQLMQNKGIRGLYDFIRMLDAENYPRAFLLSCGYRFEFRNAKMIGTEVFSEVIVSMVDTKPEDSI